MEHAKGLWQRERIHSDYGSPSGPEEGRTCQGEGRNKVGGGVWHGQEVLGRA